MENDKVKDTQIEEEKKIPPETDLKKTENPFMTDEESSSEKEIYKSPLDPEESSSDSDHNYKHSKRNRLHRSTSRESEKMVNRYPGGHRRADSGKERIYESPGEGGHDDQHRKFYRGSKPYSRKEPYIITPGLDGPLVSFKLFAESQKCKIDLEQLELAHKEYAEDWHKKQDSIFFKMHSQDPWFKEKYDPLENYQWKKARMELAQETAVKFFDNLQEYKAVRLIKDDNFQQLEKTEFEANPDSKLIDQVEITQAPFFGFDANKRTLYLKMIPSKISRNQLLEKFRYLEGFIGLSLSAPQRTHNFVRYAWASFNSEENCALAKSQIEGALIQDFYLQPVFSNSHRKRISVTPPLSEGREATDLLNSRRLIEIFDQEKEIKANKLFNFEKLDRITQLDLQILYLRKVHSFCYYSCEEYEDERILVAKRGPAFIRNQERVQQSNRPNQTIVFERNIDEYVKKRVEKGPQFVVNPLENDEKIKQAEQEYFQKRILTIKSEKFACSECEKLFKGPHFVEKHLKNKHYDDYYTSVLKNRFTELLWQNYQNDPNHYTNEPSGSVYGSTQGGGGGYHHNKPNYYHERRGQRHKNIDYDDPRHQRVDDVPHLPEGMVSYADLF